MKRVFFAVLMLLMTTVILAQNADKASRMFKEQEMMYESFESTNDAFRNALVPVYSTTSVRIDSAGTVSDSIDLKDSRVIGFVPDTAWTTANITFKTWNPVTSEWVNVCSDTAEISYEFTDSTFTIAKQTDFAGIRYLKVRSGTSGTPVVQKYSHKHVGIITRRY